MASELIYEGEVVVTVETTEAEVQVVGITPEAEVHVIAMVEPGLPGPPGPQGPPGTVAFNPEAESDFIVADSNLLWSRKTLAETKEILAYSHNELSGIQGGDGTDAYHITEPENNAVGVLTEGLFLGNWE